MAYQQHTGWRRLVNATGYSWAGLKAAWRNEEAFRQEGLLCAVLTPLALWLGSTPVERALLIGSLLLIVIVELLNTGIEAAVDRIRRGQAAGVGTNCRAGPRTSARRRCSWPCSTPPWCGSSSYSPDPAVTRPSLALALVPMARKGGRVFPFDNHQGQA